MKINKSNLFWGIVLFAGGAAALAQQLGYIHWITPQIWIGVFALVSVLAFVSYGLSNWKEWGWLFPAGVFGGLAITTALAQGPVNSPVVGAPLFFGLLVPFVAAYLTDRSQNWWALIPGAVMLFLGLTTLIVDTTNGAWIGSLFLFLLALSFLAVYLNDRTRRWALLVAYILGVLGLAPAMSAAGDNAAYYGPIFLLAVALPFFILYFRSADGWWAIIPAGALTVLAIVAGLAIAGLIRNQNQGGYANALVMGGLAVTFAVAWLRHAKSWARVVTIILAALAAASLLFSGYSEVAWSLAIILSGIYLFYSALRPKTA
jgi:hypothetical protein